MPFFNELKRTREPSFFFFPGIYAPGLRHFLEAEKITGCEIVKKQDVLPHLPQGFKVPEDIRLSPNAPRIEKRVSCLVSYYDIATIQAAYNKLLYSQDWLDWHNNNASAAMASQEYDSAMAADPSPLQAFKQTK